MDRARFLYHNCREFHKLIPKLRKIAQGVVVHEPRQILELEEIKRDEEN